MSHMINSDDVMLIREQLLARLAGFKAYGVAFLHRDKGWIKSEIPPEFVTEINKLEGLLSRLPMDQH